MDITEALEELKLKNYDEAVALLRDAAEEQNPDACDFLVQINRMRLSDLVDDKEALHYAIKGYEYRSKDSCYNLGWMYRSGFLGAPDYAKAYEFFLEGDQEYHDVRCTYELGEMLRLGETDRGPLVDEAVKLYTKAAASYYPAQFRLAVIFEQVVKDFSATLEFYRHSADHGKVDAMLRLGYLYEKGLRVDADLDLAIEWYKKAADGGSAEALLKLARLYLCSGKTISTEHLEPESLQRRLGDLEVKYRAEGQYLLGCLAERLGKLTEAVSYFYTSATEGCLPGLYRYAAMLLEGRGIKADVVEGYCLLHVVRIIASSNTPPAREYQELMNSEMLMNATENLLVDFQPLLSDDERSRAEAMVDDRIGQMFGLNG